MFTGLLDTSLEATTKISKLHESRKLNSRSSPPEVFLGNCVLKIYRNLQENTDVISIKLQSNSRGFNCNKAVGCKPLNLGVLSR